MSTAKDELNPTLATRKLQLAIALSSLVFTIGTTLHNFVIVNTALIETMMRMEGVADPAAEASGFTTGFRIVGCIYILGNALGMLSLFNRSHTLWWTVFTVNITQAAGFVMIPSSMWTAAAEAYGFWGILPSTVTDGGALILILFMIYFLIKYRSPWGQQRVTKS
ncbi:hypothetical protein SAMN04488072_11968 [Lentibacillus halodurans]|uniref:Uncharacterized protein n=1 Tax=Lentibacillus halodurans TaxID=237679 RepID=A0A1I1AEZ4_9BACI|nr:hypothetical protein [Lentibacillus halodurans]SFB36571.1 hypothetical protein SAMN04488072_11968 [Lentibacillus halodurans]